MYELTARDFPVYAGVEPEEYSGRHYRNNLYGKKAQGMRAERIIEIGPADELPTRMRKAEKREHFTRRYGLALALAMCLGYWSMLCCIVTGAIVHRNTERSVRAEMAAQHEQALADYDEAQRMEQSKQYFLSGEASREAAVNQATDAVAAVISKLSTDAQKATEAACMLARVMNPSYPDSFEEVAAQPQQWMFYDGSDKTFSQHDREIAESIVRPYMENGIIPNGLTADMVYGSWSTNDFVLRDSYQTTATMHTWRAQG